MYDNLNFDYKNEFDQEMKGKSELNNYNNINNHNNNFKESLRSNNNSNANTNKISKNTKGSSSNRYNDYQEIENINPIFNDKGLNNNATKNDININQLSKSKEIKPENIEKFRDLSPIRDSEYSQDVKDKSSILNKERKRNSNLKIGKQIRNDNVNINNNNNNFEYNYNDNFKVIYNRFIENESDNYNFNNPNMNNLYNYNNTKNNEFIYDEVNEKIFPLKNFEGESFPENLYKDKDENELNEVNNISKNNNKLARSISKKQNDLSQSGSVFGKRSNMSNSRTRLIKKNENSTGYVPWEKIVKEKVKDNLEPPVVYNEFNHGIGLRK